MNPSLTREYEVLCRLRTQVSTALMLLECEMTVDDANAVMPEPFHFRVGDFSIRDEVTAQRRENVRL